MWHAAKDSSNTGWHASEHCGESFVMSLPHMRSRGLQHAANTVCCSPAVQKSWSHVPATYPNCCSSHAAENPRNCLKFPSKKMLQAFENGAHTTAQEGLHEAGTPPSQLLRASTRGFDISRLLLEVRILLSCFAISSLLEVLQ